MLHISLVRAEAAQAGKQPRERGAAGVHHPSHLPRKLLSRWSRAAWRCHQKSPLWRPWGTGRQIVRLTDQERGHRISSTQHGSAWRHVPSLPCCHMLRDIHALQVTFSTWLSTSFALLLAWCPLSESLSVIYGHHSCPASYTKHNNVIRVTQHGKIGP